MFAALRMHPATWLSTLLPLELTQVSNYVHFFHECNGTGDVRAMHLREGVYRTQTLSKWFRTTQTKRMTVQQVMDSLSGVETVRCNACRQRCEVSRATKVPDSTDLLIVDLADTLYDEDGLLVEGTILPGISYNGRVVTFGGSRWLVTAMATYEGDREDPAAAAAATRQSVMGHWWCLVPRGKKGFFRVDDGKADEHLDDSAAETALRGVPHLPYKAYFCTEDERPQQWPPDLTRQYRG